MNFHAVHYSPPRPPVLHRFATVADREAWIADHPGMRRAIAAPADQSGYMTGPVTVAGARVSAGFRVAGARVSAGFRVAGLADLFPVSPQFTERQAEKITAFQESLKKAPPCLCGWRGDHVTMHLSGEFSDQFHVQTTLFEMVEALTSPTS